MSLPNSRHILSDFDRALDALREDAILMATLVTRNVANAHAGFKDRNDDLCTTAIADDEEVDALEKQIDRGGIDILLRFQPFSSDLRNVFSTIKIGAHLERTSDQAVGIARRARRLNAQEPLMESGLLLPLFESAQHLFAESIRAFDEGDAELAANVIERAENIREQGSDVDDQLTALLEHRQPLVRGYLNLISVAQHLDRIADCARNIAEDAIYLSAARDVRHPRNRLGSLEKAASAGAPTAGQAS
jgi:phosphate transport system protein